MSFEAANVLLEDADKLDEQDHYNDYFYAYDPAGLGKITALNIISGTKYTIHGLKIGMTRSDAVLKLTQYAWAVVDDNAQEISFENAEKEYFIFCTLNGDKIIQSVGLGKKDN